MFDSRGLCRRCAAKVPTGVAFQEKAQSAGAKDASKAAKSVKKKSFFERLFGR